MRCLGLGGDKEAARVLQNNWRRSSGVASRGTRAAAGIPGNRVPQHLVT